MLPLLWFFPRLRSAYCHARLARYAGVYDIDTRHDAAASLLLLRCRRRHRVYASLVTRAYVAARAASAIWRHGADGDGDAGSAIARHV